MTKTRSYLLPALIAVMLALCLLPSTALASEDAPGGLAAASSGAHAATLSSKAKKAFIAKLGKIKTEANEQGVPPFGGLNKVMYQFLDVDGDGKKEMLVESATKKSEISSYVHAAVYKYKSGRVKQVMVDCGWASWMGSFRCYYPKTRTLVTSFYHNSIRNDSMVYRWNGKSFELESPGGKYKKGKAVKLDKGWKTFRSGINSKMKAAYKKVLAQARNGGSYGGFKLGSNYGVFDIGADGNPELLVTSADQSWGGGLLVFDYSGGKARYLGYCWEGTLYTAPKGRLYHSWGRQGSYTVSRVVIRSGSVAETGEKSFMASSVDDWDDAYSRCDSYIQRLGAKQLLTKPVTDYSLLNSSL